MEYKHIKNIESLENNLKSVLEEIHTSVDPHEITEYRKFFKKNVSFFSRSYVAAYLLKKYLAQNNTRSGMGTSRNGRNDVKNNSSQQRVSINIGSLNATEDEMMEYIAAAPDLDKEDYSLFKQTKRHTVIMINPKKVQDLLKYTKSTLFKDKKPYVDLRGRY